MGRKNMINQLQELVVKYVKLSPQRWNTFKQCCYNEDITCKSSVCLDVATHWNSTYMMFDRAEKLQKALQRLEDEDPGYVKSVGEDDSEDDDGVSELGKGEASTLGPPTMDDWDKSSSKVLILVDRVQDALTRLYDSYCENDGSNIGAPDQTMSQSSEKGASSTSSTARVGQDDFRSLIHAQIKKRLESENSLETKSELERYLCEKCEGDDVKFNLLTWWKVNSIKCRMLSIVVQDVFAVLISTVASELAFSTAGRVLDPFRSSLSPLMVEALICTQNWLRSSIPINIRTLMDDVEEFEKIDTGM
ncbi:zinc finger BED domain-containing protein RICESLEEPER 1-like [Juglans regia]|uniref:Zinc finger BED domain-containing protein RICESLEEPER 1-like n=1 Tax=Juglans regia TaxID=51240 RepID=A0A6P9EJT1_JUGRE|nr:zinc finger BED domain-containing protein RICESLEEPER 1-like [Juglans regia]